MSQSASGPPTINSPERPGFWERRRRRKRRIKVSVALRLYNEVLGLKHLHYGLWDGEPLTLDGMQSAQQRYADRLASHIPDGVRTILDVGCGTGSFSAQLKASGYQMEGLSPDPHQQKLYAERVGEPFHLALFQNHQLTKTYDLVMMSEVAQYIWLPKFFPAVLRTVAGGHLLLADYFKIPVDGELPEGSGHPLDAFLAGAEEHGLELLLREDITEATLPTLELGRKILDDRVEPALRLLGETLESRHPWVYAAGRALLARRFARLIEGRDFIDATSFSQSRRYLILLFRVPG